MLYYKFKNYEEFKDMFGIVKHGNGVCSRKNRILLAYIRNRRLLHEAIETNNYTLLHISSMAELKKTITRAIIISGHSDMSLRYVLELDGEFFYSRNFETDDMKGLCKDGDTRSIRYINHENGGKTFKMKAGKLYRSLILETEFGKTLPEQVVTYLCEEFSADWQTYTTGRLPKNRLCVDKNFEKIYSSSSCVGDFYSCMVDRKLHYFYTESVDASAAYLTNEKGKVIARCVIYNRVTDQDGKIWRLAERQYASNENDILKRALIDALIKGGYIDGYKKVGAGAGDARAFVDLEENSLSDRKFRIECDLDWDDTLSYQDSFKWYSQSEGTADNYGSGDIALDKLEWDPEVIEEPTLKEVMMKKGESAEKLCGELIRRYRENGYFERKLVSGSMVCSHEACIFLNEVRSIRNIIVQNNLPPDEVTILCSESKSSELPKGFTAGGLCPDRNNPVNKPFTFCTKASFEGVDFYSANASTYIFINAGKEWQTLDIMLDIPQILGRQRLDINPFKHDATIYYKTMPAIETQEEFERKQKEMDDESQKILDIYNSLSDADRTVFVKLVRNRAEGSRFVDDYIDIIRENGHTTIGFNYLVKVARWNRWYQRNHYYNNSCQLLTSIQSVFGMCRKPVELKRFESWFYNAPEKDNLAGYANFRKQYPQYEIPVLANPFIDIEFHRWYDTLGYDTLSGLNFWRDDVERCYNNMCAQAPIREACRQIFKPGILYPKQEVKEMLQDIYDRLGLTGKVAKATELARYLSVIERQKKNEKGKRIYYIEILNI